MGSLLEIRSLEKKSRHIAKISKHLLPLVDAGRDVVLVMHSASGFLGSAAVEGLSKSQRSKQRKKGGVAHLIFVTAAVMPEGHVHERLPFFVIDVSRQHQMRRKLN